MKKQILLSILLASPISLQILASAEAIGPKEAQISKIKADGDAIMAEFETSILAQYEKLTGQKAKAAGHGASAPCDSNSCEAKANANVKINEAKVNADVKESILLAELAKISNSLDSVSQVARNVCANPASLEENSDATLQMHNFNTELSALKAKYEGMARALADKQKKDQEARELQAAAALLARAKALSTDDMPVAEAAPDAGPQIVIAPAYVNPETFLQTLIKDEAFVAKMSKFMKDAESAVTAMITSNPGKFAQFRELQSKGVAWQHSPEFRRFLEKNGWVFRPMMIKRDRVVCDTCGVEVSGWYETDIPNYYHDLTRHVAGHILGPNAKTERDITLSQRVRLAAAATDATRKAYKPFIDCCSAVSQIPGWLHVARFMDNPLRYVERTKALARGSNESGSAVRGGQSSDQPQISSGPHTT